MTRLELPWPSTALTPHAKGHWFTKANATRKARRDAYYIALDAKVQPNPTAILTVTYHPPNNARRDCANMHGRMKAAIDGIADAMGCDDNGFRVRFPDSFAEVVRGGCVVIEVQGQ